MLKHRAIIRWKKKIANCFYFTFCFNKIVRNFFIHLHNLQLHLVTFSSNFIKRKISQNKVIIAFYHIVYTYNFLFCNRTYLLLLYLMRITPKKRNIIIDYFRFMRVHSRFYRTITITIWCKCPFNSYIVLCPSHINNLTWRWLFDVCL